MSHRLRFAPSPTGYLHVGGARTALFNWLYVKHYGGQFLLRIEDTDKARSTDESTRAIFEGLQWLGLLWDEEVVYQGANLTRHQADARRLLDTDKAYRCFCTTAELEEQRKAAAARGETFRYDGRCDRLARAEADRRVNAGTPFVIRFRMPHGTTSWDDLVHGPISFPNQDIGEGDFIILRSDGTPVYNLAVVSDDIAMRITLVMRGDDHISNTPKQILLYQGLGAALPQFGHVPNINGTDGRKLSKRRGATAVGDYQHMGILPEAMLNFLALLGWNPGNDVEIMTIPEMIAAFTVDGLSKSAAVFDPKKLDWLNGQHLSRMSNEQLAPLVERELSKSGALAHVDSDHAARDLSGAGRDWFYRLLDLLKVRARTIDDLAKQARPYLLSDVEYDPQAVAAQWKDKSGSADVLNAVRASLSAANAWDAPTLEDAMRSLAEQRGTSAGKLFHPLRVALTGSSASPGIFDVMMLLGRARTLTRIDAALRQLSHAA